MHLAVPPHMRSQTPCPLPPPGSTPRPVAPSPAHQVLTRCRERFGSQVEPYFKAPMFLKFERDSNGCISANQFLNYLNLRTTMHQNVRASPRYTPARPATRTVTHADASTPTVQPSAVSPRPHSFPARSPPQHSTTRTCTAPRPLYPQRLELAAFDPDNTGCLTTEQLEAYVKSLAPHIAALAELTVGSEGLRQGRRSPCLRAYRAPWGVTAGQRVGGGFGGGCGPALP
jgi:hypothetical protein